MDTLYAKNHTLLETICNFISYYDSNLTISQTTPCSMGIIQCNKLTLKTFNLIDRSLRKILFLELGYVIPSPGFNCVYIYGGPVPHTQIDQILHLYMKSVSRSLKILSVVIPRMCRLDKIQFYSTLFQQFIGLLQRLQHQIAVETSTHSLYHQIL